MIPAKDCGTTVTVDNTVEGFDTLQKIQVYFHTLNYIDIT